MSGALASALAIPANPTLGVSGLVIGVGMSAVFGWQAIALRTRLLESMIHNPTRDRNQDEAPEGELTAGASEFAQPEQRGS